MTPAHPELPIKETMFRGARAPVEAEQVTVDKTGGKHRAGVMHGVSLISSGEALGHDVWIDDITLEQVSEFAARGNGLKSRFTHPNMSADGMGRHLGRIHSTEVADSRVTGDLHFVQSAHSTPEGDLAGYVMHLAEEDAAAAGLSIVFEHDSAAEMQFMLDNGATVTEYGIDFSGYESPDPLNTKNLPHVRIAELRAADIVDEPAANPEGLFHAQTLPGDVDSLLTYAAGLTETKPTSLAFGVNADRAKQFLTRWLSSHGLTLTPTEEPPMSETIETPEEVQPSRDVFVSELKKYTRRFGAEQGQEWFEEGKTYLECLEAFCDVQKSEISDLTNELEELQERLSSVELGEDPVEVGPSDQDKPKPTTLGEALFASGNNRN